MPKPDYAHKWTDKQLAALEKRIAAEFKQAAEELTDTVNAYFAAFKKRDAEMAAKTEAGEITEQAYKQWRLAQIGRGKRFEALRDKMAERYTNAHEVAIAYINDATPGIYTLNRNYSAYTIEQISDKADFTLWDEQTVRRLIDEQPGLMPYYPPKRALKRGIDLDYGKKQITASITSSILQGKGIDKISSDLQNRIQGMSLASAIRTARTATTAAQNAGRMDSYHAAEGMGIKLKKEWLATLDGRTRHAHAMLDGQTAETDKPFHVDGYEIMYPGDTSAPGYLVYNCRCTLIAALDDVPKTPNPLRRARDPETGKSILVSDMTYAQWVSWKAGAAQRRNAADDAKALKFLHADARDNLQSIVKRSTIKLENGFACFPENDPLSRYVQNVKPLKTYFDVAMHGSPTAVCFGTTEANMSPRLLASIIRHSDGWNGQKIRLLSCSTGKQEGDDYCFAEELANALGVEVKAPNDLLYIYPSGRISVGPTGKGEIISFLPNQRERRR
nr:MAG TPA: minor capsid protein [Caudoviricetes sp.]